MKTLKFLIVISILFIATNVFSGSLQENEALLKTNDVGSHVRLLFVESIKVRRQAVALLRERDNPDVIAALINAMRFIGDPSGDIADLLHHFTEESYVDDWFKWMSWLQTHPEIKPFDGYTTFKSELFKSLDPNFEVFIYPDVKHEIGIDEVVWGGVEKDGIPALTNPNFIDANEATFLNDTESVFGVEINGDVRAYPYRIMDWHEMFNDVIGGVPVSLAYCTLCGSGILFDTRVEGRDAPFVFGSSGFLYRSNKLMYDQQTHSLWNQFTGRPVVGELTDSGIELKILPVVTTTWGQWKKQHPKTKVLSLETGYRRNYKPGKAYSSYFNSPKLMFPAPTHDKRLKPKDQVFGLRLTGSEKAWPLTAFSGGKVINDRVGIIQLVIIGDTDTRTVRAYRTEGRQFSKAAKDLTTIKEDGKIWQVTEHALIGPEGENLSRLPGHIAYWFAWSGYLEKAVLYN